MTAHIRMIAGAILLSAALPAVAFAADPPVLSIVFDATTDVAAGLEVPSAGDGTLAVVTIGGQPARRCSGERSRYLYVIIRNPTGSPGPREMYVTAEVFDDQIGFLELEYDAASDTPDLRTKYTRASPPALLTGGGCWREVVFRLPDLRLGRGQNLGADFRFVLRDVALRRIAVSPRAPPGYDPAAPFDAAALRRLQVDRPAGLELTFGNDATPAAAALYRALGVSSIESYVDWAGVEPKEGTWDWSEWDRQVDILHKADLKWVPFLIAGPAYATPLWFQRGTNAQVYRCLDHDKDSAVQSMFNPALRPPIRRFIQAFAAQYAKAGVIESLLLGVSGIYGESIYPAGPEGGWTARLTGDYHNHTGWWAADPLAARAFREAMKAKYRTVDALNAAWSGRCASFDAVTTFRPDRAPNDRARADFVEWYQQAMTEWSVFWVRTIREAFPETPVYLCTGGDGDPVLGADFTAQARAVAPFRAGVRITNEGSDYAHNFTLTREVATATRLYGTYCGFEPASGVTPAGNVARIYNATASGARQLHCYNNNVLGNDEPGAVELYRRNIAWLAPRRPHVDAALYVPRETWSLEPARKDDFFQLSRLLRDTVDHDYVTRQSVADGALRDCRLLVLAASPVLEPEAAAGIEAWVRSGGFLVVATRPGDTVGSRLHDNAAWRERLFAPVAACGDLLQPACDDAPAQWALAVGGEEDGDWLLGDWHGRERRSMWSEIADATMRWTGAKAGVLLPVRPGADYSLRIAAYVPGAALGGTTAIAVRVNGREVGRIAREGRHDFEFHVPAPVAGTATVARLEMSMNTWKPADDGHSRDERALGIAVRQIAWHRAGAERVGAGRAALRFDVNGAALGPLTRNVGKGRTILLPGLLPDFATVVRVAASVLHDAVDGRIDNRFATRTDDGILWFDAATATIVRSGVPPSQRDASLPAVAEPGGVLPPAP